MVSTFWRQQVATHWASGWAALRATPWPVWFTPPIGLLVILAVAATPFRWFLEKDMQEAVAPSIVTLTLVVAFMTWRWVASRFTLIALLTVFSLFMRELHFGFTNWAIYFALAALVWWFSMNRTTFGIYLSHWWLRLWLGGAFLTFFVADLFDAHVWSFLPGYWSYNDIAEETLETLGHIQLFMTVLLVLKISLTVGSAKSAADA